MRLLIVHERLGPFGGAEANVLLTAQELGKRGHSVGIAHCGGADSADADWRDAFEYRLAMGTPAGADAMSRALARFQPDVAYLHKLSDLGALHVLVEQTRPVVRMVHDHDLCCMRSYKYNYFSRRICTRAASPFCVFPCGASVKRGTGGGLPLRWVSYSEKRREIDVNRKFHRMVVATAYMRDELLRNGFAPGQIEIHAPVTAAARLPRAPSFGGRNLIVYSGQVIRGKGVDVLLESLSRVEARFECVILGDGSHRAECERLSRRLGLDNRVHFAGYVPQASIAEVYRDASLAVMSSLWPEPFGAAGLEAMRCGLPVIAFDAGGIREWLIDGVNGFLIPWMDRDAFAAKVDTLILNKELARGLGANGRALADKRFSLDAYVGGLENLLVRASEAAGAPVGINAGGGS
jgi:glycosyltransferase involved in cell wall biosynthesis